MTASPLPAAASSRTCAVCSATPWSPSTSVAAVDSSSVMARSVPFLAPVRRYPSDAAKVNLARFLHLLKAPPLQGRGWGGGYRDSVRLLAPTRCD
ncbi:exported protein of unknown function [uncultured Sphingopyxis sp.]|uniref:Uncharacterized protein n=1 Tax=uncultured Sphingopyxis sp. TaxID=310581 RepID=A0A1Y5Q505_9SPHN|nr:exported protein of unknown function [uncultured Sphingopyxis sp.]